MSETLSPITPADEIGPGKEEIASAAEVLQALLKTAKAFRIYLPNNPLLKRFIDESVEKTTDHLRRFGKYQMDVDQFELSYGGKKIHENRDPKESVAFRMYSDGIRSIFFTEGVEGDEICSFLDIVGQDRPADTDDDIVTLLWMKDLPHISYLLAEDFLESDQEGGGLPTYQSQKESIRKIYEAPPETAVKLISREIQPITEEEIVLLKREVDAESTRNPLQEVMTILSSVLVGERDPALFKDFLEIVQNLVANLLHAGKTADALKLIRFLRKMEESERVPPGKREMIRESAGEKINPDAVLALQGPIDGDAEFPPEDLPDFIHFFGKRHLGTICELLGRIQKMKMRKAIIAALVQAGQDSPGDFLPFLKDQRWYLVRNIIHILNLTGSSEGIEEIIPLINHQELRVRKEVFSYIQKFSDPHARTALMKYLQDESMPLRIRALQVLSAAKYQPALKNIEMMIAEKEFQEKDLKEKLALYEALAEMSGDSLVPRLREMLLKRYWFGGAKEGDAIACAVAGLKKIRTPAAVETLQKAAEKKGEHAPLITRALRELEAAKRPSAPVGGENG